MLKENPNLYSLEKARGEAEKLKKIISEGRAKDYSEAEAILKEEIMSKYLMRVINPFHKERKRTEKPILEFMHPEVLEFSEKGKKIFS